MVSLPSRFLCDVSYGRLKERGVLVHEGERPPQNEAAVDGVLADIQAGRSTERHGRLPSGSVRPVLMDAQSLLCSVKENAVSQYLIGGDENCNHSTCNYPLKPGHTYRLQAFACTNAGCTRTRWSHPVRTEEEESNNGSLIMAVVVVSFLLILTVLVVLVSLRFKGHISRAIRRLKSKESPETINLVIQQTTRPVSLSKFMEHVEMMHKDSNLLFSEEYKAVTQLSPKESTAVANNPGCRPKNRYTNVLPFDHARVKLLPTDDDDSSDYINASFIPGFRGPREYIAAQGPLPSTTEDFWRMVWENGVTAVVMLTQCVERGKVKCEEYWPADPSTPVYFGDLHVTLRSASVLPDYVIRVMDVKLGNYNRTIHQFHFLKWPDFGCPDKTYLLLNLVAAVRDHTPHNPNHPMLVHCSAGVGRTGTFIALDILLQQIRTDDISTVDIFGLVLSMRKNRPLMVQRENQYIYIYDCLRDAMMDESEDEASVATLDDPVYQNG
ncbi:tyrosine-protein phosphatase 10D [Aplysia californica]|uniref:Tyrosine-protein phosphatase 10D n=1 Tax=Aplysia californica TaxID=6500 RepID=A0ABM1VTB6_APLCA|nr:tyrosine-protein phosphatase 10D [Aplysia californica]